MRRNFFAELPIRKFVVPDEVDVFNAGDRTFGNLENQIDPVLRLLNDFGLNRRAKSTGLPVQLDDPLRVFLNLSPREQGPGFGRDLIIDFVSFKGAVPFEDDAVDDRVFNHLDQNVAVTRVNNNVSEKPRRIKRLQAEIDAFLRIGVARREQEVGRDRIGFHTLVPRDLNTQDTGWLRELRRLLSRLLRNWRLLRMTQRRHHEEHGHNGPEARNPIK